MAYRKTADASQDFESKDIAVLVEMLQSGSRRQRQNASAELSSLCGTPEQLAEYTAVFIDCLGFPEARTRWECFDILTAIVPLQADACESAVEGADDALFGDADNGPLRLAAVRFLCAFGATSPERSDKVWPIIDEAIQCYHGDLEFQDMLVALIEFSAGKLSDDVRKKLRERITFDATSGKNYQNMQKLAQRIMANLS